MKDIIKLHDKKFKIMIPAEKIDEAVTAVACIYGRTGEMG